VTRPYQLEQQSPGRDGPAGARFRQVHTSVLDEPGHETRATSTAVLSEPVLADWNREEEVAAWAHLQQASEGDTSDDRG
jgi:hypothetical protein